MLDMESDLVLKLSSIYHPLCGTGQLTYLGLVALKEHKISDLRELQTTSLGLVIMIHDH